MNVFRINKSGTRQHISFVANVAATQISETDTHFVLSGVPVVVDGATMNGIVYPKEENEKGLNSLVGKVLTLGHPFDDSGAPIDAYSPKALQDNFAGGTVTKWYKNGDVNLVDMEIKKSLLNAQDGGEWYYNRLKDKKPIGVSTGLYLVEKDKMATEQSYNHLAMLPEDEAPAGGDATFIRFNSAKTQVVNVAEMILSLKHSANETAEQLRSALRSKYNGNQTYVYVEDWDEKEVIFCVDGQDGSKTYKLEYSHTDTGIELIGDPVEVKRKTVWMKINEAAASIARIAGFNKFSNNGSEAANGCNNEGKTMDRNQIIALLTGKGIQVNKDLSDTELMELLGKSLAGNADNGKEKENLAEVVQAAVNAAVKPLADKVAAMEQSGADAAKAKKEQMVNQVLATNSVYTKEELEAMPDSALEKMAANSIPAHGAGYGQPQFNNSRSQTVDLSLPE